MPSPQSFVRIKVYISVCAVAWIIHACIVVLTFSRPAVTTRCNTPLFRFKWRIYRLICYSWNSILSFLSFSLKFFWFFFFMISIFHIFHCFSVGICSLFQPMNFYGFSFCCCLNSIVRDFHFRFFISDFLRVFFDILYFVYMYVLIQLLVGYLCLDADGITGGTGNKLKCTVASH